MKNGPDMNEYSVEEIPLKPSIWQAAVLGWLVQLVLKTVLPLGVLATGIGNGGPSVWYAQQAAIFLGSLLAGAIAARIARGRPLTLALALLGLSLATTFFEQFPATLTPWVALVWAGGPCLGLLLGIGLARCFAGKA